MASPFKFLDAYQKEDGAQFFGRDKETAQLYNAVFASNITVLYGASGTGKTSLVNCGLGNKFYDTDWVPLFIRRKENINDSLDTVMINAVQTPQDEAFPLYPTSKKIEKIYLENHKPIYLIFDQFEELFILGTKEEQRQFYHTVTRLLKSGVQAKVLLIMREEWMAYLNEFERILPTLLDNRLRVERMDDRNIFRVLSGTIKYHGIAIKDPAKTILKMIENLKTKRERVDLTNLQVYLDRLFEIASEEQKSDNPEDLTFNLDIVQRVGKIENVLSDFLDEQFENIEERLVTRGMSNAKGVPLEILFCLVTDDGTKQALTKESILQQLPPNMNIRMEDVAYCMEEFRKIKMIRQLE